MANTSLGTYLNDHLAGSTMALELLAHLEEEYANTTTGTTLSRLHAEITADRQELEALMARLDVAVSLPRRASAWLMEKAGELKLHLDNERGDGLGLLQGLETLAIGIEGKRALWQALGAVAEQNPALREVDYQRLISRADEQRAEVERLRLSAAHDAFA